MKKFLIVFFAATSILVGQVPTDSLVAYYPFNGNANDESGHGYNGIVLGATLTLDRFGNINKAYYFNGTSDWIGGAADSFPTAERTVSIWFNTQNLNGGRSIFGYGGGVCGTSWIHLMNNPDGAHNNYEFQSHCGANRMLAPYTSDILNEWHNWCITTSDSGTIMYIDGDLKVSNNTFVNTTSVSGTNFAIGVIVGNNGLAPHTDSYVTYFQGALDDIRIYNRVLSETEIGSLYHEGGWPLSSHLALNSKEVNFGSVALGELKDTIITILNAGNDTLKISDITSNSPSFFATTKSYDILPGIFVLDTIYFAPVSAGSAEGKLIITSNAPTSPDTITVTANVVTTDVSDVTMIPKEYSLSQNFPNPFNPETAISYSLPTRSRVHLYVYNILGQVVADLVNTEQQTGIQSVVWNANVASGLYFYRIETVSLDNPGKRFVETKKMVLIR